MILCSVNFFTFLERLIAEFSDFFRFSQAFEFQICIKLGSIAPEENIFSFTVAPDKRSQKIPYIFLECFFAAVVPKISKKIPGN